MLLSTLIYILEIIGVVIVILMLVCLLVYIVGFAIKAIYWLANVITNPDESLPDLSSYYDDWLE